MNRYRRTISGALTNALSLFVHIATSLILVPVILRAVGPADYATWVLLLSIIGYFTLFDLGIRSAVVRFTAAHDATSDAESLSRITGAALLAYALLAVCVAFLTICLSHFAPSVFPPSAGSFATLRVLVLVLGFDAAISLPLGVFGGVLEGMQRFTFLNGMQIAATLVRTAGFVIALQMGGRLLAIASIAVATRLIANFFIAARALALMPHAPSLGSADSTTLLRIARHSSAALCLSLADRVRFQADAIVISVFAPAVAITNFAIAARLSDLPGNAVQMIAQVFTPASSRLSSLGERDQMRELVLDGNFVCALLVFAAAAVLTQVAPSILALWAGPQYAIAAPVVVILVAAKMLYFSQSVAQKALIGVGEHGELVRLLGVEAALNLVLSFVLVRPFGIMGVAVGTAAPMTLTSLVFLPLLMARKLGISLTTYFQRVFLGPAIIGSITALAVRSSHALLTWTDLLLRTTVAAILCAAGLTIWIASRTTFRASAPASLSRR